MTLLAPRQGRGWRERARFAPRGTFASASRICAMFCAENRRRQQCGVDGPGLADGQRANRDAAGHLRNGEQRVEAFESFRFDRNAEHRQHGLRGGHPGQVRRAARACDNDLDAALFGGRRVLKEQDRACGERKPPAFHVEHPALPASWRRAPSFPSRRRSP